MKKFIKVIIIAVIILSMSMLMIACNDGEVEVVEQTITISTAEELIDISNKLGEEYSKTTFELQANIDLSGIDWTPIGDSITNAFTGTFDGNGYTISNVTIGGIDASATSEDLEEAYTAIESAYVGLFGYSYNATFEDIAITYDYSFSTLFDYTYVGGLVGYAYGDTTYTNIDVDGNLDMIYAMKVGYDISDKMTYCNDGYLYAGGVVGYAIGNSQITTVASDYVCNIVSNDLEDIEYLSGVDANGNDIIRTFDRRSRFNTVFSGGVVGYMRNINISASSTEERNKITNATVTYDLDAVVDRIHSGGIVGTVYNCDITNTAVTSLSNTDIYASIRAYAGGVAGVLENSTVATACSEMQTIKLMQPNDGTTDTLSEEKTSHIAGGAVAYMSDNSVASDVDVTTDIYSGLELMTYCGGLVGVINSSTLTNATATGLFYILDQDGNNKLFSDYLPNNVYSYYTVGGAVGKISGQSQNSIDSNAADISNVEVSFTAYQGIVGTVISSVEVEELEDDEYENTYFDPIIDNDTCIYDSTKILTYGITEGIDVGSNGYGTAKTIEA